MQYGEDDEFFCCAVQASLTTQCIIALWKTPKEAVLRFRNEEMIPGPIDANPYILYVQICWGDESGIVCIWELGSLGIVFESISASFRWHHHRKGTFLEP